MDDRLAIIDMDRKVGAAVPLSVGGAGSPSNTMSPGPRSTCEPSGFQRPWFHVKIKFFKIILDVVPC